MFLCVHVVLVGFHLVIGQTTLTSPPSGNCGEDVVMTCNLSDNKCETGWGLRKNGLLVLTEGTTSSKYSYSGSVASGSITFKLNNMELADAAMFSCYCSFNTSPNARIQYECKPRNVTAIVTPARKISLFVDNVYPEPTQILVTLDSSPLSGTPNCTVSPILSSHYRCTWLSSSSLDDVDGGYRMVVKTVTETALSGRIKIVTPDPPLTNSEQLPDGRWVIRVNENRLVTMVCVSHGGIPAPTVSWYRDNTSTTSLVSTSTGVLQGDRTYTVTLTHSVTVRRSDDLKTFVCRSHYPQASDLFTKDPMQSSVLLYLNLKPSEPTVTQTNTPVSQGTVLLECRTSGGRPVPGVTWTYRGQTFSPQAQSVEEGSTETFSVLSTLQRSVTAADNGEPATCHVSNEAVTAELTSDVELVVKFPVSPGSTALTGNKQIEATGSNRLYLNCTTGSSNPASNIIWMNGSTVIPNSNAVMSWTAENRGKVSSQMLTLRPVRENDGDVISCSVTNSDKDVAASQGEAVSDSISLDLVYSPIIKPIANVSVDEGQVGFALPCTVSSKPVPTITWIHNGSYLASYKGTITGDGYSSFNRTFTTVSRDDRGTYRCYASNGIGLDDSKDIQLNVRYVIVTATNTASDSSTATVTCALINFVGGYEAKPWVQKWQSNGKYVEVSSRPFTTTLTLTQLTYEFSGIYTCTVKAGESGAIYVQGNTSLLIKSPPILVEPKVQQTRYKVGGRINHNTTVPIQYYSNVPGSDVKCYRNTNGVRSSSPVGAIKQTEVIVHVPVFSNTVPKLGNMATVTIMVLTEAIFGDYDIVLFNGIGNGSTLLISITPESPPDAPLSVKAVPYGPDATIVMWIPGFNGNLDQTFVIQLSTDSVIWSNHTEVYGGQNLESNFWTVLDGLTPSTLYYIRLFAYNSLNWSDGYSNEVNISTAESSAEQSGWTCTEGQFAGGMIGALVLGLLVGVSLILLMHRFQVQNFCSMTKVSIDKTSSTSKDRENIKDMRRPTYQNTIFTSETDATERPPSGYNPGAYEDLLATQRDYNYDSLQTAGITEGAYYEMK